MDEQEKQEALEVAFGCLEGAINDFYGRDIDLLHRLTDVKMRIRPKKKTGLERSIAFRIAFYFQHRVFQSQFGNLNVDLEYTKAGNDPKREDINDPNSKIIWPDLILHQRGTQTANVLAIEFKAGEGLNHKIGAKDRYSLRALTSPDRIYTYALGLFVSLNENGYHYVHFSNGEEVRANG
jgi:hypothetical protein